MKKWVKNTLDECKETFCEDDFCSSHFTSIYLGGGTAGRFPFGRYLRRSIWLEKEGKMYPFGIAGIRCKGLSHNKEYGEIRFQNKTIVLNRKGNDLLVLLEREEIGIIRYSKPLRIFYFGSAELVVNNERIATLKLPFIGPSLYQRKDCFGKFLLKKNQKTVRFLLNPKDDPQPMKGSWEPIDRDFLAPPSLKQTPLFLPEEKEEFQSFNQNELYLFLVAATWAPMFFTYA